MKTKQSELAKKLTPKTSNQPKTNRLVLLISFLLVSIVVSYFIWRKTQISDAQKLVYDCSLNNNCFQIVSALEILVRAQKNLKSFNLANTNLVNANLANADLYRTDFANANLAKANLKNANLYRTDFANADLANANLAKANLKNANLKSAKNLTPTQIKSACNWEKAFYKGRFDDDYGEWIIDRQANQQFIQQLQQDTDSDPKKPVNCSKWKNWSQEK